MHTSDDRQPETITLGRLLLALTLIAFAALAAYRAWVDMATIGIQDPEQSQVLLALPAVLILLHFRRDRLMAVPARASLLGVGTAAVGWGLSWYGYMNAVQSMWHFGAVLMVIGAVWSVLGNRAMWVALPALVAMAALVPVPNLLRQDIALPLQRMTATGAEFMLVAFGFDVERMGQTLFYQDKPITIEEACNGMRMVFALVLVCYTFVMAYKLNAFARLLLLGVSPLLAVACNIVRVVPTVIIYGEYGDTLGDRFHDISGWGMIIVAALMLMGLLRLLTWAEIPIYAPSTPPGMKIEPVARRRSSMPAVIAPSVCITLLIVAAVHTFSLPNAADAMPYHNAVAQAERDTPIQVAGLNAKPIEIPEGSLKLLRPNIARAVQYTDTERDLSCQFMMIQSKDARDLSGHYPPRCYPNVYGYIEVDREHRAWAIEGITLQGIEYTFAESNQPDALRWVVMHYFALPGGGTTGKLSQMQAAAADYLRRHHGAAQVQLMFSASAATQAQRDVMFERIMSAHSPLLRAVLDDQAPEADTNP